MLTYYNNYCSVTPFIEASAFTYLELHLLKRLGFEDYRIVKDGVEKIHFFFKSKEDYNNTLSGNTIRVWNENITDEDRKNYFNAGNKSYRFDTITALKIFQNVVKRTNLTAITLEGVFISPIIRHDEIDKNYGGFCVYITADKIYEGETGSLLERFKKEHENDGLRSFSLILRKDDQEQGVKIKAKTIDEAIKMAEEQYTEWTVICVTLSS